MVYIENVLDNYYKISLEDRVKLINKIWNLHEKHKYEFQYNYSDILNTILMTTEKMLQAQSFEKFYNSLNAKEKKEFQTQVYLTAELIKGWIWFDIPKSYENISELFNMIFEEAEEADETERFEVDFDKLDDEFNSCDSCFHTSGLDAEKIINTFITRYYYFAFNKIEQYNLSKEEKNEYFKKYSRPLILEFNSIMKKYSFIIKENVNDSTRKNFESIPYDKQIFTIFKLMDINKNYLDEMIERRQKIMDRKKQSIDNKSNDSKKCIKKYVKKRLPKSSCRFN